MKVKIEFQYFEECPNHKMMFNNLLEAIKGLEDKVEIQKVVVEDEDTAKRVKFRGSPTLLINNNDIENLPEPEFPVLACRFYSKGIPSKEVIRERVLQEISV